MCVSRRSSIADRLEEAKTAGELAPDVDARELAACLFGIVYGVRVKVRANEAPERIRAYKDRVLVGIAEPAPSPRQAERSSAQRPGSDAKWPPRPCRPAQGMEVKGSSLPAPQSLGCC